MSKNAFIAAFLIVFLIQITSGFSQELIPSSLFCDNMVLQQGTTVPIWRTSKLNEKITIQFADQTKSETVGNDGKWMINFCIQ